jgi:hypothetical protein
VIDLRTLDHLRDRRFDHMRGCDPDAEDRRWAGAFRVHLPTSKRPHMVIASSGDLPGGAPWDHVSVSLPGRCPTWSEMDHIKRLFFAPDETAMQLHVPESEHISNHPYCLHIWRPTSEPLPVPPSILVGLKALGELAA